MCQCGVRTRLHGRGVRWGTTDTILVPPGVPKNKHRQSKHEIMSSVIDRVTDDWMRGQLDTEIGKAVCDMLMQHYPWQTFSTLTTKQVASPERMKQIVWRTLHRRPLKGVQAFWVLEPFKERGGVHAHILTRNEPNAHSWTKTWDWYHNKQGIGRFESKPIFNGHSDMFKVAAYISKYCTKQLSNAQWGFHGIGGQIKASDHRRGPKRKGTEIRSHSNDSLRQDQAAWRAGKYNRPNICLLYTSPSPRDS